MNLIKRWDPFREMEELQEKMTSLLGRPARTDGNGEELMKVSQWAPLVDISEDEKEYLIKTELPEIKKEDVKVTVENGILSITGDRKLEKEEKNKKFHRVERAYGSFIRRFTVPEDASGTKVNAEFKDGVLKVHLPKNEEKKAKEIEVKVT
jgi:HSP20 family protein